MIHRVSVASLFMFLSGARLTGPLLSEWRPSPRVQDGQMTEIEDRILTHVGLYRVSFAQVIERLFLDGDSCGRIMNQLAAARRVRIRKGFDGSPKYYQLTRAELTRRGLPHWRARRPRSQDFPTAVSILWFCTMSSISRHLLERPETDALFPKGLPEGTHCIEQGADGHRLYRVRVTSPNADEDHTTLCRSLRKRVSQAMTFPGLRPWVTSGRYAFAVLTECLQEAEAIRNLAAADSLLSLATVEVVRSPGLNSLRDRTFRSTTLLQTDAD